MKKTFWSYVILVGVTLAVMSGCVSRKEIIQFKESLTYLEEKNKALEERSARLDSLLNEYVQTISTVQAEMSLYSDQLQQRFNNLEARMDDLGSLYSNSSRGTTAIIRPGVGDSLGFDSTGVLRVDPKKLYDTAYLDLTRGNYALAISGFDQYVKYFPDTPLSDNALYWVGESHYAQAQYDRAALEFQKVLQNYPTGDKVPAALYKTGLCYLELKDKNLASQFLNRVAKDHPRSPEANLAKAKLKSEKL
jgi:tol-pal system protein YbgF